MNKRTSVRDIDWRAKMELKFRDLRADEVECRVATVSEKGCSLLLYKDARCDMNILDETVGVLNWQRHHSRENANCTVSIWDSEKQQWIEKEDTGTESYTEKEKGLASDSFKRACFNLGIGRELYTAPFIWISGEDAKVQQKNGKWTTYEKFSVTKMDIVDGKIIALNIANDKTGKVVYSFGYTRNVPAKQDSAKEEKQDIEALKIFLAEHGVKEQTVLELYKLASMDAVTPKIYVNIMKNVDKILEKQKEKENE